MNLLKLKAKIYKYFGIYLAHKEELEHITNTKTMKNIQDRYDFNQKMEERFPLELFVSLEIGSWQGANGLTRRYVRNFPSAYKAWYKNLWINLKTSWINILDDMGVL
jgi:hypothetical protein